jgi:hypothetical protein
MIIVIIFINKTLNLQGIKTLSKIHIYLKMIKKNMSCTRTTINIYYKKLYNKICSKIHLMKKQFGKRTCSPFLICTQLFKLTQYFLKIVFNLSL